MSNESIKEKIRKCLNVAAEGSGAAEGEMRRALEYARTLMHRHGLSEDEVQVTDDPQSHDEVAAVADALEYKQEHTQSIGSNLSNWEVTLIHAICELVGTVQWYRNGRTERRNPETGTLLFWKGKTVQAQRLTLYGPVEDVEDARELISEWQLTIVALARMKYGGALQGSGRNYAEGFASAVYSQVTAMRRKEETEMERLAEGGDLDLPRLAEGTDSAAIVLRDRGSALALVNSVNLMTAKKEAGTKFLEDDCGIKLQKGGKRSYGGHYDPSARAAGRADGAKANVSHSRKPKLGGGA